MTRSDRTAKDAKDAKDLDLTCLCGRCDRALTISPLTVGSFSRVDALLEIRFVDVEQAHPREAHLVDRALAVADPVARVRVVLVRGRVVMPRGDVNHRARGQERRDEL